MDNKQYLDNRPYDAMSKQISSDNNEEETNYLVKDIFDGTKIYWTGIGIATLLIVIGLIKLLFEKIN